MRNDAMFAGGEAYDLVFRALGDPHRIRIVELLKERELSAGEILELVDVVQSTLSHHMKTLSESGVVNAARRGKWTYYSLNEQNLAAAAAYLEECARGTRIRKQDAEIRNAEKRGSGESETGKTAETAKSVKTVKIEKQDAEIGNVEKSGSGEIETGKPVKSGKLYSEITGREEKSGKKKEKDKKGKKGKKNKK